jgi:hypothetical protein
MHLPVDGIDGGEGRRATLTTQTLTLLQ